MNLADNDWAIDALKKFIHGSDQVAFQNTPGSGVVHLGTHQRLPDSQVAELAYVAEKVLDRVLPEWRDESSRVAGKKNAGWNHLRDWSARGIAAIQREEELEEKLGDAAPRISVSSFHPWIWDGARSLWQSRHYLQAVQGAILKLNAETQNKLGRRDISETDLFVQAFSENDPKPGQSRLLRMQNDDSKTFKSVQRGARNFAEGVFAGIRNPLAHETDSEMPEQQALEYLAALSVLARWVDDAELEVAT